MSEKSDTVATDSVKAVREGNSSTTPLVSTTNSERENSSEERAKHYPLLNFLSSAKKSLGFRFDHAKELATKRDSELASTSEKSGPSFSRSSRKKVSFDVASCQLRTSRQENSFPVFDDSFRLLRQFRVTGGNPVYTFTQENTGNVFFITSNTIETFDSYCNKILDCRLPVAWEDPSMVLENDGDSIAPKRFTHVGGIGGPQVILAITARYIEHLDEVVVAHEDGSLRSYSCTSGSMGVEKRNTNFSSSSSLRSSRSSAEKRRRTPCSYRSVAIEFLNDVLVTGCADGCIRVWQLKTVIGEKEDESLETIVLTNTYEPILGSVPSMVKPTITAVSLSTISEKVLSADGLSDTLGIFFANAEGYCGIYSLSRQWSAPCFVAHSSSVTGLHAIFDGLIVLTLGRDCIISITEVMTGRCLARKRLQFVPTTLFYFKYADLQEDNVERKPELCFLVGGAEGQVELYRLIVMSLSRFEFHLIRKLHERSKSRRAAVNSLSANIELGVIIATFADKTVRMWRMTEADIALICMETPMEPEDGVTNCFEGPKAFFNSETVIAITEKIPFRTRIALYEGLIEAQKILAVVTQNSVGLSESSKDFLVSEFERIQTFFQQRADTLDTELQLALQKISHRYHRSLVTADTETKVPFEFYDVQKRETLCAILQNAGKELAAFETNWAIYKHHLQLRNLCREVSVQLRACLVSVLQKINTPEAKDILESSPCLSFSENF
eukprot:jgi/Galph1/4890/GphlegSOOS_G3544.1